MFQILWFGSRLKELSARGWGSSKDEHRSFCITAHAIGGLLILYTTISTWLDGIGCVSRSDVGIELVRSDTAKPTPPAPPQLATTWIDLRRKP